MPHTFDIGDQVEVSGLQKEGLNGAWCSASVTKVAGDKLEVRYDDLLEGASSGALLTEFVKTSRVRPAPPALDLLTSASVTAPIAVDVWAQDCWWEGVLKPGAEAGSWVASYEGRPPPEDEGPWTPASAFGARAENVARPGLAWTAKGSWVWRTGGKAYAAGDVPPILPASDAKAAPKKRGRPAGGGGAPAAKKAKPAAGAPKAAGAKKKPAADKKSPKPAKAAKPAKAPKADKPAKAAKVDKVDKPKKAAAAAAAAAEAPKKAAPTPTKAATAATPAAKKRGRPLKSAAKSAAK